jgi:ribosomal-protein-alanine N-acetyltransferase
MTDAVPHVFLQGRLVYLRALEARDLEGPWFQWLNDEEVCRHNGHAIFPNTERRMREYFESTQTSRDAVVFAVVRAADDRHVGNISLQRLSWVDRSGELAILMGDREVWGTGAATEAGALLLHYGFVRLGLHRIHCGTSAANTGMQKLALRLGMTEEGRRREAMFKNGAFVDVLEYGILRADYRPHGAGTVQG